MSIALKLAIEDVEAELAAAPPRERPAIQKRLDGHRAALAAAQERGATSRAASRVAARAAVVTVEPDADDEAPKTCTGCGQTADPEDKYCAACGSMLPLDDEDFEAPDSPPSPEAVQAAIDGAVYRYAAIKNGKPLKVGDLATFGASMRMRAGVQRTADAVRARADIASRSSGRGSR